ncbi:ATP-binding protein [Kitasatospora sp. NPDC097605]|uniref:ATP-dependent nuclease n=1 Tax=Kitasatospora sp. NPDC097605 TaxID=3157226 RepID=UPI00331D53D5
MIKDLKLRNFKAFNVFSINFRQTSLLVGPNSAGKSTVLAALRLAEACLRLAKRVKPSVPNSHGGAWYQTYPLPVRDFAALNESVRHNFRDSETSLELRWKNGCKLRIVWPEVVPYEDAPEPFFYLLDSTGNTPRTTAAVKASFSTIGVIPTLSPLEHEEPILEDSTVRKNLSGRLSSRHFRNQLRLLVKSGEWNDFLAFASPWLAGIRLKEPVLRYDTSSIDVFFTELGSGVEKELVWAGDGVQIWLQLLLHIYRAQDLPTLVLDEPEVFLHADLQRRLIRMLESMDSQVILATHSTEVLAEADRDSIVWVDKSRRSAVRAPQDGTLVELDAALGTSFNLAMAKALRARGVLFVEGKDTRILKRLARSLGLSRLSEENTLAIVPMNGYTKWEQAQAFGWFLREFLSDSVKAMVIFDRDYRTAGQVDDVVGKFAAVDVNAHVWKKKELESYLIIPTVISRLVRCPIGEIESILDGIMVGMEDKITARLLFERQEAEKSTGRSVATINEAGLVEFRQKWAKSSYRYNFCPPKEVLSTLNRELQARSLKATSFEAISSNARPDELDPEMVSLLRQIEELGT